MKCVCLLAAALCIAAAAAATGHSPHPAGRQSKHNPWMRVPGGHVIHRDCIYSVENMHTVTNLKRCQYRAQVTAPEDQMYSMDVHYTPSSELMTLMNASFVAPSLPSEDDQQVVYFWPGFKSTAPTMGLPVLQPVLQYGTDCCGGGNYWCVRSWFVYGNEGIAYQSPEVKVSPGDLIVSSMSYDDDKQLWTIYSFNSNSSQNSTLFISNSDVLNTQFHVAMLVLETIMDQSVCADLPSSDSITFSDVSVNGRAVKWTDRVQDTKCGEKIADQSSTVTFHWASAANKAARPRSRARRA